MRCLLINLDRAPERLAFMAEQFRSVGVPFERLEEVGTNLSEDEMQEFIRQRPAAPVEAWSARCIGNFLGHSDAWERVASGSDPAAAIFEDDVHLAADIAVFLSSFEWIPPDADIVRLEGMGTMKLGRGRRIPQCPGRRLHRAIAGSWGCAGYVLTAKAAKVLLAAPPSLHVPADHFMFTPSVSPMAEKLVRYQIVPSVCIQDEYLGENRIGLPSLISPGRRVSLPPPKKAGPFACLRRHRKMTIEFRP